MGAAVIRLVAWPAIVLIAAVAFLPRTAEHSALFIAALAGAFLAAQFGVSTVIEAGSRPPDNRPPTRNPKAPPAQPRPLPPPPPPRPGGG